MGKETFVKYKELLIEKNKLKQIESDLGNARLYQEKIVFLREETGGLTAEQAVYGFSSMYNQTIDLLSSLSQNTESFLENIGEHFENVDESQIY